MYGWVKKVTIQKLVEIFIQMYRNSTSEYAHPLINLKVFYVSIVGKNLVLVLSLQELALPS